MDDTTNPETEVETLEDQPDDTLPAEPDTANPDDVSEEIGEDPDDIEDYEIDGKVYALPKAVRDRIMMQADYTRKTQEAAALRKEAEAERARVQAREKAVEALFEQKADLREIDRRLETLQKVNWAQLEAQDPVRANSLTRQQMQLQNARTQLTQDIAAKEQELSSQQEREFATLWEQGNARLAKQIPNWGHDTAKKLSEFAVKELGYAPEQIRRARPEDFQTLYLASIGRQFLTKQRAPKPKPEEATTPVTPIRPRRNPRSNEPRDDDPPDVWVRKRNAQLAAR